MKSKNLKLLKENTEYLYNFQAGKGFIFKVLKNTNHVKKKIKKCNTINYIGNLNVHKRQHNESKKTCPN